MSGPPFWLEALHRPEAYPHPVEEIRLIETHLSRVFLTGRWAYKFKKPIALPFVDFSTLEKRKACCEEELRLNRRTVPGLYDAVVTLVRTETGVRFAKEGEAIEYAVRMRQFPQSDVLLAIADEGRLTSTHIDELAASIAAMHSAAAASPDSSFGTPETVRRYTEGCLPPVAAAITTDQTDLLEAIGRWVRDEAARLDSHFLERRSAGCIRECHGDLHLGNIVLVDGVPQPFDCIEFNAELRFIDVISDLAFVVMDLIDHQRPEFAWQLLNGWLDRTGDFKGLAALRYYSVYRALVRAKVAAIRLKQPGLTPQDTASARSQLASYLDLAQRLSALAPGHLVLMHGLSGSGKSFVGRSLALRIGAVCLRSDVERKRSRSEHEPASYSDAAISGTYDRLLAIAETVLQQGHSVLVDATFLKQCHRSRFEALARNNNAPWTIIACEAPQPVLEERVRSRHSQGGDPSEATVEVVRSQCGVIEPLTSEEQARAIRCDTSSEIDWDALGRFVTQSTNPSSSPDGG